ncbi:fimbria/pilus periplasmic chaperone [Neisseriaceae bacterium TC5R-5]|nr:fimbria/pilus periplasmic chaperone [Neisseriaceae bacterium TC5R-5]
MKYFLMFIALISINNFVISGVVINTTRVIYPETAREVSVQLQNKNPRPTLVQSWVDSDSENEMPEQSKAPFFLRPPLTRIETEQGQALRLVYNNQPQLQDRESVFWLNVLEIPPSPDSVIASQPYLQMAIKTQIKVFFRPKNLSGSSQEAPKLLIWHLHSDSDGSYKLECENPTPFHISFGKVDLKLGTQIFSNANSNLMIKPFSKMIVVMNGLKKTPATDAEVRFSFINDYGAYINLMSSLAK